MSDLKKLAEWAFGKDNVKTLWGFTEFDTGDFLAILSKPKPNYATEQALCFNHPENPQWQTVPDFPNDLNACFKWLVPKLDRWVIRNYEPCVGTYPMPRAKVSYQGGDPKIYAGWLHGEAEAETPALALCEAIEKLIDAESNK